MCELQHVQSPEQMRWLLLGHYTSNNTSWNSEDRCIGESFVYVNRFCTVQLVTTRFRVTIIIPLTSSDDLILIPCLPLRGNKVTSDTLFPPLDFSCARRRWSRKYWKSIHGGAPDRERTNSMFTDHSKSKFTRRPVANYGSCDTTGLRKACLK